MKIGIIGTGAIAAKQAQAWQNIGCGIAACTNQTAGKGREFAARFGAEFVADPVELCERSDVELVDVCTFPDYRLEPVKLCASLGKPVQLQKPIARTLAEAQQILEIANRAGITVGVVSQHRFDDSSQFLHRAISASRLGRILQADCYVKWYRPPAYYSRSIKGSWAVEGGGALINQAIHQVDLVRWLIGPVRSVKATWQLGAIHKIESEDIVNALLTFENEASGVIQASTAFRPGYPERIEIHGTKGSAMITGDRLTRWDVPDDGRERPPLTQEGLSGASDPMAISLIPFERQFADLLSAIRDRHQPLVSAQDGVNALGIVEAIYDACRAG
jgi:UDP-N-acetyl-2-amino-2-deoxyglucuronate dehydrogenase